MIFISVDCILYYSRQKVSLFYFCDSGKTFLAKALYTCKEPEECNDETIGIDCFHWKHKHNDEDTLEILIVDCAGQKKYMLTHQLFLSTGVGFVYFCLQLCYL